MAIQVKLFRQKLGKPAPGYRQVIVPVRFGRACTGAVVKEKPDPDDRGFALGSGSGLPNDVRGAMVALVMGQKLRLKVFREDIDSSAPLFVTSSHDSVRVTSTALGADGEFEAEATGFSLRPVKIMARLGANNGPVLGEMLAHVIGWATVPVCCHLCTITGTALNDSSGSAIPAATGRTRGSVTTLFETVNAIWVPLGIRFSVVEWKNTAKRLTSRQGNITDSYQGHVAIDDDAPHWAIQAIELRQTNRRARTINVYFVRGIYDAATGDFNETLGIGKTVRAAGDYGVVVADPCHVNDLAHELGHVLNLDMQGGENIGHSDDTPAAANARDNIWVRRRLMYSYNPTGPYPGTPGHWVNVGYGTHARGALLAVKNLRGDPTDGEYAEARNRVIGPLP